MQYLFFFPSNLNSWETLARTPYNPFKCKIYSVPGSDGLQQILLHTETLGYLTRWITHKKKSASLNYTADVFMFHGRAA